jgi:hypothetical protein
VREGEKDEGRKEERKEGREGTKKGRLLSAILGQLHHGAARNWNRGPATAFNDFLTLTVPPNHFAPENLWPPTPVLHNPLLPS